MCQTKTFFTLSIHALGILIVKIMDEDISEWPFRDKNVRYDNSPGFCDIFFVMLMS